MSEDRLFDVAVVGGGIVGLATAFQLLRLQPALSVAVIEKEAELGAHQTGHNSGVLHAGLYYTPGSLKARLCREGKAELERFADEHGIPYRVNIQSQTGLRQLFFCDPDGHHVEVATYAGSGRGQVPGIRD